MDHRSLEATIREHSGAGGGAFAGKGQTLAGGPAPADGSGSFGEIASGLDPQMTLLLGLLGLYGLYWYFSKA